MQVETEIESSESIDCNEFLTGPSQGKGKDEEAGGRRGEG